MLFKKRLAHSHLRQQVAMKSVSAFKTDARASVVLYIVYAGLFYQLFYLFSSCARVVPCCRAFLSRTPLVSDFRASQLGRAALAGICRFIFMKKKFFDGFTLSYILFKKPCCVSFCPIVHVVPRFIILLPFIPLIE